MNLNYLTQNHSHMLDRDQLINDLIKEDPTTDIKQYLEVLAEIKAVEDAIR